MYNNSDNNIKNILKIKSLRDVAADKLKGFMINKVTNHFGITLRFSEYNEIMDITKILKYFDPKFNAHVINQHLINDSSRILPLIDDEYVIIVRSMNAFIYVNGAVYSTNENNISCELWLYIFGKGAYRVLKYIKKSIAAKNTNNITNYTVTGRPDDRGSGYWNCIATEVQPRPFDTLFFDNNVIPKIKTHLAKWQSNIDIYKSRGLNYKTGILIHGPAGTGKSSLAVAIASYLDCDMVTIDMSTFDNIDIPDLVGSINADNARYVVFLDEIDVVFKSRDGDITDTQRERTTKLLTFLDSANSPTNVVFVATTNYLDRLDDAVTRKGRFDLVIHVDNLSAETAEKMCEGFNTDINNINIEPLAGGKYNPATLQSAILDSKDSETVIE